MLAPFLCPQWHISTEEIKEVIVHGKTCQSCRKSLKKTLQQYGVMDIYEELLAEIVTREQFRKELCRRKAQAYRNCHLLLGRRSAGAHENLRRAHFIQTLLDAM